jgi:hypothetical protein
MYVAGQQNFAGKKLEECGIEWRMANNSEKGQGKHRAVVPMLLLLLLSLSS